ncbi:transposase-like zinc-binding domain-containing protein, partial [Corynebacterium striatum]
MSKNRPRCPVCAGQMKKNGTTSKGTTRWRCKDPNCGSSTTRTRTDLTQAEVPRVLFLGLCLVFHYFSTGVVFPKIGFYFSRRAVAQALVE